MLMIRREGWCGAIGFDGVVLGGWELFGFGFITSLLA